MRYLKIVLIIFSLPAVTGCERLTGERGNGVVITKDFDIDDFNSISVEGNFDIRLEKSNNPGVTITTDENLIDFIVVESYGDKVRLISDRNLISEDGVNVVVSYSELRSISVGGAAILTSDQTIEEDYLDLNMSGAGAVELDLNMKALEINISGAGAMELTGQVVEQRISMDGAGGLDAENLVSERCEIEINGVGGAAIHVTDRLIASVSGVGGITYKGNPYDIQKDVSGIGTIQPED